MKNKPKVMMVGSAEKSKGGVSTVIKILKNSPIWDEYECYWLETQIQDNKYIKLFYAIRSYIICFFKIKKYDIIHFHTVPDISLLVQLPIYLLAMLWKKKIILQLHVGNQIEDYKNSKLFQFCIKHSDYIILLANLWVKKFNTLFNNNNIKVDYLYNAYSPVNPIDYTQRTNTIVFAAHLNSNKAYDVFLKGFKEISNQYPTWKLIIMGDGEIEKAKLLAQKLKIEKQVIFTGYITGKEKEKYFQKASIFCMCSYKEGFPMVVIEAWAYGIPVVTTPVGGLPEVLIEKKNALIFNFGDYVELSKKLDTLISSPQLRLEMSKYSQEFVKKSFSIDSIVKKLSSIYASI